MFQRFKKPGLVSIMTLMVTFQGLGADMLFYYEAAVLPSIIHSKNIVSRADAITFLKQAAVGLREKDIRYVMRHGYEAWIDRQFRIPLDENKKLVNLLYKVLNKIDPQNFKPEMATPEDAAGCEKNTSPKKYRLVSSGLWWKRAIEDDDQLRQKVAYALSQIIVVSAVSPAGSLLVRRGEGLAYYYDILQKDAFANYKTLLKDITYSPAMNYYMTYNGSAKYDPAKGTSPDENYARELMQLFTIGPSELNLDGTVQKQNGRDLPSYTQEDVMNGAKVFTGWDIQGNGRFGRVRTGAGCYLLPITFYPEYHDTSAKRLLGQDIPANQSGEKDIESELDILMNNKNIAPFISKRLIERMTTSNPSPAYVRRVARVFNDNGHGVKGDLKAVIKAILLDKEVREGTNKNRGRADELLTSLAHLYTAFGAMPTHSWKFYNQKVPDTQPIYWADTGSVISQAPMSAPDVFNFYDADYAPKDDTFVREGLKAPELQIQTSNNLIKYSNFLSGLFSSFDIYSMLHIDKRYKNIEESMTKGLSRRSQSASQLIYVDLTDVYHVFEKALDGDTDADFANLNDAAKLQKGLEALVDYLDDKMMGNRLPDEYRQALIDELKAVSGNNGKLALRAKRIVVAAIVSIATSPYYVIIR